MTPEQRYLYDTMGYIHLENVLSPEELTRAQEAVDRYINTPPEDMPVGFGEQKKNDNHRWFHRGFGFDRALEHLTMHPTIWPIIKEMTGNKPCLCRGNLMVDTHEHASLQLHGGISGQTMALGNKTDGIHSPRGFGDPGTLYSEFFDVFWYLTDVNPGDGGFILVIGSHKAEFELPYEQRTYESADELPDGVVNITPKAGDCIVSPESIFHGSLQWKPKDRDRRFVVTRYVPQHQQMYHTEEDWPENLPQEFLDRLAPETRELIEIAWRSHEKEITKRDQIRLI